MLVNPQIVDELTPVTMPANQPNTTKSRTSNASNRAAQLQLSPIKLPKIFTSSDSDIDAPGWVIKIGKLLSSLGSSLRTKKK